MNTVKVVGITQPVGLPLLGPEELVAYAARVSNPSNQMNSETAPKLLKYLMNNHHWSPFEMVSITMEINTTRDIARQILRHRSFSFQEFSQRYADVSTLGDMFSVREARLQDLKNRQNSLYTDDQELKDWWEQAQADVIELVEEIYHDALENGIAKEQARAVLPEGLTKSRLYMSGTLRSWIHYCELRSAHGTQLEHQEIAIQAKKALNQYFPSIFQTVSELNNG